MTPPRWLIVGDGRHDIYERSLAGSLSRIGVQAQVCALSRHAPLHLRLGTRLPNVVSSAVLARHAQRAVRAAAPTHVLVWRAPWLSPRAVRRLRRRSPSTRWIYYSNDSLFPTEDWGRWRYARAAAPLYDDVLVYRETDGARLSAIGVDSQVWLPGYDGAIIGGFRGDPLAERPFDLVFVGHHAHDGRAELLTKLASSGLRVGVFGPSWPTIAGVTIHDAVYGSAYGDALAMGRLALVLYSRRNNDVLTRRSFEVPHVGTPMLALRSPAMMSLFRDGVEVLYFDGLDDVAEVAEKALADLTRLEDLRQRAATRVDDIGGGIDARARELAGLVG